MSAIVWPSTPHIWLDDWILWRFKGSPSPRPAIIPDSLSNYPYALEVLTWCTWQRKGKPDPRPNVTTTIPSWAFDLLKELNAAVPIALPDKPVDWLLAWAITRFTNQPKPSTVPNDFSVKYPYVWSALRWFAWRRKSAPLPRPVDVPAHIPVIYWSLLDQLNQAVPLIPPPPPPPPVPSWTNSWRLPNPIMFTTWGWQTDSDYRDSNTALQRMFDAEVKTVALQIGQFTPDVPDRVRSFGFKVALWGIPDANDGQVLSDAKADGYIPQIEGPYQYIAARNNLDSGIGAGLSLSTVTTLAGLETYIILDPGTPQERTSTEEAEELKRLGLTHAWVECYKQDPNSVHFPISKMMWAAGHQGMPYANPLIGLYWGVPITDYQPELAAFGKQIGSYTSETMTPQDWIDFKNL